MRLALLLACACARAPSAPEAAAPDPAVEGSIPPAAAPDPAWVAGAVQEALEWEIMPGTTAEEDDGTRAAALRTFFLAHPEYADPARREALAAHACGLGGTEAAHQHLASPPAPEPLIVQVSGADWRVFVAHADRWCTSDDWSWYSNEASEAAAAHGAVVAYGDPKARELVIRQGEEELARVPLAGQGFLIARAGAAPEELGYGPTESLSPRMAAYFGAR